MKFVHATIHTKDKDSEVDFYKKYVGLKTIRAFGNIEFLGNEDGETLVEIIEDANAAFEGSGISLGFACGDVESYREKLAEEGLNPTPVISPNPAVKFFFVTDPAGVTVQFI